MADLHSVTYRFIMRGLQVGEKVMAKWPGGALWYPAVVIATKEDDDDYNVRFEEGTEYELPENQVSRESSFRRRSRSRSPARKSPTRRRSRSPARKASPHRKSSRSPARTPPRKATTKVTERKPTPTRTSTRITETSIAQSKVKRTVEKSETYSTRSVTRSGVQSLSSYRVPKTTQYESGGPIGVLVTMLVFLFLALYLYFACGKECGFAWPTVISLDWRDYYDPTAYGIIAGWLVFQFLLHLVPVGREAKGALLSSGIRLKYRLNGSINLAFCMLLFAIMTYYDCGVTVLCDKFLPLMAGTTLCAFTLALVLYILARYAPNHALSPKGNTGNLVYDFFMGHELNPRPLWNVDMKLYVSRVSVIAWACINIAFLIKGWEDFPNNPPYPLVCVIFFQLLQMFDSMYFEVVLTDLFWALMGPKSNKMLKLGFGNLVCTVIAIGCIFVVIMVAASETLISTLEVIHDGLGFQTLFILIVYIPFVYTLPARYLVDHPLKTMPQYCLVPIILFCLLGYVIYRQSNSMKTSFRQNPNAKDMKDLASLPTGTGKRLLVAGWWRYVRKPNYLGDLMMALSWSLFCGFDSALPYFYPVFLTMFLVGRERDDSKACKERYGAAWDRYCKRVPYRFIPYIY